MRNEIEIAAEIGQFYPTDGNWLALEALLEELWAAGPSAHCLPALFTIFERFPNEDGAGVFWSILHGLEHLGLPYEKELRESLARQESEMGAVMLSRLEKAKPPER
ncbi:hypothetical protein D3C87_1721230 [compost metagenome]